MKTLFLIDAHALIHRAFHALPPLTTPEGEPAGAIYGISNTLIKLLKEQKPDYIAAAFDRPEPTFRKELFKDYKAHRPPAADELIHQIIKARELFEKFNISIFEKPRFEADDIIGALVNKFKKEKGLKITILTGDLDTLQLIKKDRVVVQTPKRGISETTLYNEKAVIDRYGLAPSQLPDYKGLVGDPSDNIPGVPGIGPKTASKILKKYRTLENLYKKINEEPKLTEKLLNYKEQAFFSKKLATIYQDVPLEVNLKDLAFKPPEGKTLTKYFAGLGFQSLIKRSFSVSNDEKRSLKEERDNTTEQSLL
ncbi:MAG: hypothetical protein KJI72_02115 [Patescibacteria group bacterium]|nr:hypothetical protein [Patescibacteria group bacterium]